jgi:hypothetical protein
MTRPRCAAWVALLLALVWASGCADAKAGETVDHVAPLTLSQFGATDLDETIRPNFAWADTAHVVLLNSEAEVLLVGPNGVERRAGRRGEGPGEYRFPYDVDVMEDGRVLILDGFGRKVQVLDHALRDLGRRTTPKFVNEVVGRFGDTLALMWQVFPADSLGRAGGLLAPGKDSADLLWRFGEIDPVFSALSESGEGQQTPDPWLVLRNDRRFVLAEGRDYRLWLLDLEGRILAQGGRPGLKAENEEADAAAMEAEIARARRIAPEPALAAQAEHMIRRRYTAPRRRMRRMAVAPDRILWVIADRGGRDSTRIDLFDPELAYLGTLTVAGAVWGVASDRDRVAFLLGDPGEDRWRLEMWRYSWTN